MGIEGESGEAFFDRYNAELEKLNCGARIVAPTSRSAKTMTVVDLDGKKIADLPRSIGPRELVAVMLLVEQSFEQGVEVGRALERAAT